MFGDATVKSVYEEAGGTVELSCQLDFNHDTETQRWNYYPARNELSNNSEPVTMVTRWPRDDAQNLLDPSFAFNGKWNLTDAFGILLRNITTGMEGFFQCGKSLTDGREVVDAVNYLNVTINTNTKNSVPVHPTTITTVTTLHSPSTDMGTPDTGYQIASDDGNVTSAILAIGIVLPIVVIIALIVLLLLKFRNRSRQTSTSDLGSSAFGAHSREGGECEEKTPFIRPESNTEVGDTQNRVSSIKAPSIFISDVYGFIVDEASNEEQGNSPDGPKGQDKTYDGKDLNPAYRKIFKRLGNFAYHLEDRLEIDEDHETKIDVGDREKIIGHLIQSMESETAELSDQSPFIDYSVIDKSVVEKILKWHASHLAEKRPSAPFSTFAATLWVWLGNLNKEEANTLRSKILSGRGPKEVEKRGPDHLNIIPLSKYGSALSLCSVSSFLEEDNAWIDQTLRQIVLIIFYYLLVSELNTRSKIQQKEAENRINQYLIDNLISDDCDIEEIHLPGIVKSDGERPSYSERISKYCVEQLGGSGIIHSRKQWHMLHILRNIVYDVKTYENQEPKS